MERSLSFVDKSSWPPGAWQSEPDKITWTDSATGLVCIVRRSPSSGALCGYVGIGPDHRYYGVGYDEVDVWVHGGLTYADACENNDPEAGICHVPEPGQPDELWWLGFDCGHGSDVCPLHLALMDALPEFKSLAFPSDASYKDVSYVKSQCEKLATQLHAHM